MYLCLKACKFLNKPEYMKRAMELWGESCNRGNGFHCIELSRELVKQKDEKKAEEWRNKGLEILRGACDAKDAEACYIAAQEYYKNRNELQAYEDFTTACDLGEGPACFILGTRHKENTREYFEMIKRGCQSEVNGSLPACWRMGERMVQAAHSSTSNSMDFFIA
jgi:TPR repeat protein